MVNADDVRKILLDAGLVQGRPQRGTEGSPRYRPQGGGFEVGHWPDGGVMIKHLASLGVTGAARDAESQSALRRYTAALTAAGFRCVRGSVLGRYGTLTVTKEAAPEEPPR